MLAGVVIAFGFGGVGNGMVIVYQRLILQRVVAEGLLGRVFGMQAAADGAAFAAAFVFTGAILSVVSPRPLFAVAGVGSALVALVAYRSLSAHPYVPQPVAGAAEDEDDEPAARRAASPERPGSRPVARPSRPCRRARCALRARGTVPRRRRA